MQPTHPCAWQEPTAKGARIRNQSAWEHKSRAAEGPAITCSGCDCCGCHMLSSTVQRPCRSVLPSRHTRLLEAARTNLHRSATLSQENSALGLETSSWTSRCAGVGKCCRGQAEAVQLQCFCCGRGGDGAMTPSSRPSLRQGASSRALQPVLSKVTGRQAA